MSYLASFLSSGDIKRVFVESKRSRNRDPTSVLEGATVRNYSIVRKVQQEDPASTNLVWRTNSKQARTKATKEAREQEALARVEARQLKLEKWDKNLVTVKVKEADCECVLCWVDLEVGSKVKEMPCKHMFHSSCIEKWLRLGGSCPVCGYKLAG